MEEIRYFISDASKQVDVETHVLRYWEGELGISIPRNEMGHRYYTEFHIRLFRQVKKLKEKGYQLKAIKAALEQTMNQNIDQNRGLADAAEVLEADMTRTLLENQERLLLNISEPEKQTKEESAGQPELLEDGDVPEMHTAMLCKNSDSAKKTENENKKIFPIDQQKLPEQNRKEKDGQIDMKSRGREQKRASAWERRNGIRQSSQAADKKKIVEIGIGNETEEAKYEKEGGMENEEPQELEAWQKVEIIKQVVEKRMAAGVGAELSRECKSECVSEFGSECDAESEVKFKSENNIESGIETDFRAESGRGTGAEVRTELDMEPDAESNANLDAKSGGEASVPAQAGMTKAEEPVRMEMKMSVGPDMEMETGLTAGSRDEKMAQFQSIMNHIIGQALTVNNEKLSRDISGLVNQRISEELEDLMRIRDEKEEERYRQIDEIIRSCQRDSQSKAEAAAAKIPFFKKKRFGRSGKHLGNR